MAKTKHNPNAKILIDKYIIDAQEFAQPICTKLRGIILATDLQIIEDWKWGPNYQKNGMVCGFGAFKQHVTLTFFQGSILKDAKNILIHGTSNQHNRNIKFKNVEDIDEATLTSYIKEAVQNNLKGVKSIDKTVIIPEYLKIALQSNNLLKAFEVSSFTNRKEYVFWIESAKRQETRQKRLAKATEKISKGIKFS